MSKKQKKEKEQEKERKQTNRMLMSLSAIASLFIFTVFYAYYKKFDGGSLLNDLLNNFSPNILIDTRLSNDKDKWGVFGDYIGGVLNPILAFLSFIAVLFTIESQNKQFKKSEENQAIQSFENLFTHMSTELAKIYDDFKEKKESHYNDMIALRSSDLGFTTRSSWVFSDIHAILNNPFASTIPIVDITDELRREFKAVRYFMYLYQILKLIDKNEFLDYDKKLLYTNLIRASIENDILQLLYLNCFYHESYQPEFKYYHELVTKFSFFEHMTFTHNRRFLSSFVYLSSLYNKRAFGQSIFYRNILVDLLKHKNLNYQTFQIATDNSVSTLQIKNDLVELNNFKNNNERISFFLTKFDIVNKNYRTSSNSIIFETLTFVIKEKNLTLYLEISAKFTENCLITLHDGNKIYDFTRLETTFHTDTP